MSFSTPVEIDTEIARIMTAEVKPQQVIDAQESYLASKGAAGHKDHSDYFNQAKYDAALLALEALHAERGKVEDLYTGWQRYFHVTNVGGHIHTSTSCSSCFATTQYAWRTDLSGLTEQEVVDREAYNACTVCMPIAPAEQKAAREYFNKQQREAKAAERQAKKDDKLRKQAERAVKFLAKADKIVAENYGSWERLFAEYSLNGHDGKKSYYASSYDLPSQVADYIYDEFEKRSGKTRGLHGTNPKATIAEAREKGLIA